MCVCTYTACVCAHVCVCVCHYLVADLIPLALQQLEAFLQECEVISADHAPEGVPQQEQGSEVIGPAFHAALQLLGNTEPTMVPPLHTQPITFELNENNNNKDYQPLISTVTFQITALLKLLCGNEIKATLTLITR